MHPSFGWDRTPGIQGTHRALGVLSACQGSTMGRFQARKMQVEQTLTYITPQKNGRKVIYHDYLSSNLLFYRKLQDDMGRDEISCQNTVVTGQPLGKLAADNDSFEQLVKPSRNGGVSIKLEVLTNKNGG
jgi:hypothetical protein